MKSLGYLVLFLAPLIALLWFFAQFDWLVDHDLEWWCAMSVFTVGFYVIDRLRAKRLTEEDALKGIEEFLSGKQGEQKDSPKPGKKP